MGGSFFIGFGVVFSLIPGMFLLARRFNIIDTPDGTIKCHSKPVPYLGGVALYSGVLLSSLFLSPYYSFKFFSLSIGLIFLLVLGFIDDLVVLKPGTKFLGQIIIIFFFLAAGFKFAVPFLGDFLNYFVSFFWMLSLINAFNLIDVMDGLAATIGFFAAAAFLFFSLFFQVYLPVYFLSALLGGLLAYFWYNRPPARIYLGDAGSLFLGGIFAVIATMIPWGAVSMYGFLAPIIILAIPFLEVATLIGIRFYKGIPVYNGSPDHFSHYLRANGWSVWQILLYIALLMSVLFIVSFLVTMGRLDLLGVTISGGAFCLVWFKNLLK